MNPNLARSMEIIEFVCTHFADSTAGLVPDAQQEPDADRIVALVKSAAHHLDAAAAELKMAREGDGAGRENP